MQTFIKDQTFYLHDVRYRVVRPISETEVQLENTSTGQLAEHKTFNLLQAWEDGSLKTAAERKHDLMYGSQGKRPTPRMKAGMSAVAKAETWRRIEILNALNAMGSFEKSREELCGDIKVVAAARRDLYAPHVSTVYRWRKEYLKAERDVRALFAQLDRRGGKGQTRLQHAVEALIDEKIDQCFLNNKRGDAADVYDAVFLAIQVANAGRPDGEHLKVPGLRTIQRRIANYHAFDRAVAQFGQREAERRFATHGRARAVRRILEIVEIDHTPIDLMVVDDSRKVIGRPTLTVILDRMSRCVLGIHLSLAGHGTPAVFAALRHALFPKTYLEGRYKDLGLAWPCFGWIERIVADNGREFHADAVRDALANLGIVMEYAGSKEPNDKPHVERFMRTINYTFIHKLPGTTLSNVHERVGFAAEKEACLTLEELDRLIHVWICSVYHCRPHAGLDGRAPIDVWRQGADSYPPQLKMNRSDIDIEFSQIAERQLQHYGIDLNTFEYSSERLMLLRRMLPENSKVTVKWPSYDAGHVWIWSTIESEYFQVPNKDTEYAGLTVEQAQRVKKRKAEGAPDYRQTNAEAKAMNAEIVSDAAGAKELSARRKGARYANQTSDAFREEVAVAASAPPAQAPRPPASSEETIAVPRVAVEIPMDIEEAL